MKKEDEAPIKDNAETEEHKNTTEQSESTSSSDEVNSTDKGDEHDSSSEKENDEMSEIDTLKASLTESENKYLRLYSDFENFRRRTAKERLDLSATAGAEIIQDILPVIDDLERAIQSSKESENAKGLFEGVQLVYNKLMNTLGHKGLKVMEVTGDKFDPELHEAVTRIPAPKKKQKGCVVDVVEKGYKLNDKVIRFPKVVIGE